jgi:putative transposase
MLRAYKTELNPNNKQRTLLLKHAGAARWAYNWGLAKKIEEYQSTGNSPSAIDLHKQLNLLKKTEISWMYEVSKMAPQEALRNLDIAFKNFFRNCKKGSKQKGFPRFKSKKNGVGSFTFSMQVRVINGKIQLPRLGKIRLKETDYFPTNTKIRSATVSEKAGRWFVSILVDEEFTKEQGGEIIGVDVGIKTLATLSNGIIFENSRSLKKHERKLRRRSKSVSRKKKGSNNRKKEVKKLAKLHYKISCTRKDSIHKATTAITKQAKVLCIENLNVSGMMKNHKLAKSLSDASMGEFLRQLEYKASWANIPVIKADRFFASSKLCSNCGCLKETLSLGERIYCCEHCNLSIDRDLNAAINLKTLAGSLPDNKNDSGGTRLVSVKEEKSTISNNW